MVLFSSTNLVFISDFSILQSPFFVFALVYDVSLEYSLLFFHKLKKVFPLWRKRLWNLLHLMN